VYRRRGLILLLALAGVIAALTAMGATAASKPTGAVVKIGPSNLGKVLVDAKGKTLYYWAADTGKKSNCYGECAKFWPPLLTKGKPVAKSGALGKLLGTTVRRDGKRQVTYNGRPLYYFLLDKKAGQTNGAGSLGFGARWDPVSRAGRPVRRPSIKASVLSPRPGESAGARGTFSVGVSLQALSLSANELLKSCTSAFNDPNAPTFGPGPNAAAPGLVVLLSSTPTLQNTALQGPNTNLAGVFQINDVTRSQGLTQTFNSWTVTSPGSFGNAQRVTLTVYAVSGTAPAVTTGNEQPISNVVRQSFTIAG
jgi:predicted lipoprotein with Yx(FWY)xxD motif